MFICTFSLIPAWLIIELRGTVCPHTRSISWLLYMVTTSLETRHSIWKGPLITGGDHNSPEDSQSPGLSAGPSCLSPAERWGTSLSEEDIPNQEGIPRKICHIFAVAAVCLLLFYCLAQSQDSTDSSISKIRKESYEKIMAYMQIQLQAHFIHPFNNF